ncbi:MAG: DNA-directed RNA polymerase subunit omega [Deltaproteobacteria bacterium]|nr:DNA-directed RNA polymerase subunit omega [Deltaproteobacteria bacterium]
MARVTVEDCLRRVPNRFSLVHLTAQRVRQLRDGAPPMLESKNKEVVLALREIASGEIYPVSPEEAQEERARAEAREKARLFEASAALEARASRPAEEVEEEEEPLQEELVLDGELTEVDPEDI